MKKNVVFILFVWLMSSFIFKLSSCSCNSNSKSDTVLIEEELDSTLNDMFTVDTPLNESSTVSDTGTLRKKEEIKTEIKDDIVASKYYRKYNQDCKELFLSVEQGYKDCFDGKNDCEYMKEIINDPFCLFCKKKMMKEFDDLENRYQ
jgi:hypothetical protein